MNKFIKKVIVDIIIFLLILIVGFIIIRGCIKNNYYFASILYTYDTFIIFLIVNLFINIGRIFINKKNYKKYLSILLPILLSICLYFFLKGTLQNSIWGITDYKNVSILKEFRDFYNSIYNYFLQNNRLLFILLFVNLYNIIITIIYFFQDKFTHVLGYIIERIIRILFTFTPIILFIILIFMIPYTFYYPRMLQYLSILLILFMIGVVFYRIFISLLELKILNFSHINKETLLVIISQDNYTSKTIGLFKNPLSLFKYYNINNIVNNLVIRGKNYSFVSYDAIRYNLVKLKGYKNIEYVFLIDNKKLSETTSSYYKDYIKSCISEHNHFVFLLQSIGNNTKDIQKKYPYQCICKACVEDIVNIVHLTQEDIFLRNEVFNVLKKVPNDSRFDYISSSLNKIVRCYDDVEILYSLLKLGEYMVHYRALKNIVNDPGVVKNTKSIIKPAFGVWANLQNITTTYTSREIIVARDNLIEKLERSKEDKENKEVTFNYLVNLLVTIRNKYIGHGTISNKLARNYNYDIFIIIKLLIKEFKSMDMEIQEDNIISNLFDKDIYAIKKVDNTLYLYMNNLFDKTEYLDYKDGKIFIANTDNKIYLNKEEVEYAEVKNY